MPFDMDMLCEAPLLCNSLSERATHLSFHGTVVEMLSFMQSPSHCGIQSSRQASCSRPVMSLPAFALPQSSLHAHVSGTHSRSAGSVNSSQSVQPCHGIKLCTASTLPGRCSSAMSSSRSSGSSRRMASIVCMVRIGKNGYQGCACSSIHVCLIASATALAVCEEHLWGQTSCSQSVPGSYLRRCT